MFSLTGSGFMSKNPVEETGHTDAAADVRAHADDCARSSQYASLTAWGRRRTEEVNTERERRERSRWMWQVCIIYSFV